MFRLIIASIAMLLAATPALADQLIDNVDGIRIDEHGAIDRFNGLWIDNDGRIKAVLHRGDKRPANVTYAIDEKGKVMMPGIIDAHTHVMDVGLAAMTLDLSDTKSLDDALAKITAFAKANPARPWILGRGWSQTRWQLNGFPTAAQLDSAVSDRPIWLESADGHAGWANSVAMQAAGVKPGMSNPKDGRIVRIGKSIIPSGVFVDSAMKLIERVVPKPRPAEQDLAFGNAQDIFLSNGVTAVTDMGTTIEDWQAYRRAGDAGRLKLRIMAYADGPDAMDLIAGSGPTPWLYNDRLRLGGVELKLDGVLGLHSAWLKQPYADNPKINGARLLSASQLRNIMVRASLGHFQVAINAVGDAANADALDAVAEVAQSFSGDLRWRIEQAQIVDPADIPKFGRNGIVASMQPLQEPSDHALAEARLGPERIAGAYAWHDIAATGAHLAFGSNAPGESVDPFAGIAAAITRTNADGEPFGGWQPQQRVSFEQAFAAYTSGGAHAGFAEGRFGKLVSGELADFLIVDRDPTMASPSQLRSLRVLETWIGGERAYQAP
ncbi:amidohydrolase family protein [Porphyrobacter algicida]|uniref:Amidohydrolase family protein n=1 Tax=Qipengyuania algicida TaxID=1836209 RepID=A0A845ACY3_9SPHN|nr:amidohydrolase [Qipengyuania algicida]MXP27534.1 amidohydrolase family protein [Qipengyuania algicida]